MILRRITLSPHCPLGLKNMISIYILLNEIQAKPNLLFLFFKGSQAYYIWLIFILEGQKLKLKIN